MTKAKESETSLTSRLGQATVKRVKGNVGAIYTILSSLILSTTGLLIQWMKGRVGVVQMAAFRVGGQVVFLWPLVQFLGYKYKADTAPIGSEARSFDFLPLHDRKLLLKILVRATMGTAAMTCYYKSFTYLPIGDASCFMFANSIVVSLLAAKFLNETMTRYDSLLLFLSVIGCCAISQPIFLLNYFTGNLFNFSEPSNPCDPTTMTNCTSLETTNALGRNLNATDLNTQTNTSSKDPDEVVELMTGVMFGLATTVFAGLAFFFIRFIGKDIHFTTLSLHYALLGSIVLWPMAYINSGFKLIVPNQQDVLCLSFLVLSGFGAQGFRTLALQNEKAHIVSLYGSTQIFFSFMLEFIFFKKTPNLSSTIGALLICGSVVLSAIEKGRKSRSAKKELRKKVEEGDQTETGKVLNVTTDLGTSSSAKK